MAQSGTTWKLNSIHNFEQVVSVGLLRVDIAQGKMTVTLHFILGGLKKWHTAALDDQVKTTACLQVKQFRLYFPSHSLFLW